MANSLSLSRLRLYILIGCGLQLLTPSLLKPETVSDLAREISKRVGEDALEVGISNQEVRNVLNKEFLANLSNSLRVNPPTYCPAPSPRSDWRVHQRRFYIELPKASQGWIGKGSEIPCFLGLGPQKSETGEVSSILDLYGKFFYSSVFASHREGIRFFEELRQFIEEEIVNGRRISKIKDSDIGNWEKVRQRSRGYRETVAQTFLDPSLLDPESLRPFLFRKKDPFPEKENLISERIFPSIQLDLFALELYETVFLRERSRKLRNKDHERAKRESLKFFEEILSVLYGAKK